VGRNYFNRSGDGIPKSGDAIAFDHDHGCLNRKKRLPPMGLTVTLLFPPGVETALVTADQTTGGVRLVADSTKNKVDDAGHERLKAPPPPPLVHVKFTFGGGGMTVKESSCNICQRKLSELASVI